MELKKLGRIYKLEKSVIELLQSNDLLQTLIRKEYTNLLTSETNLEDHEINDIKSKFLEQKKITDDNDYKKWLVEENTTEEEFLNELTKPYKLAKFCSQKFLPKAKARFLQRKNDMDQVIYSLIRVKDTFLAKELVFQLNANESTFTKLAEQYSEGFEKHSKGIVGPIPISKSHPTLAQLLRSAEPGKILGPIICGGVTLILRLESLQEATFNPQIEQEMTKELFDEWLAEEAHEIARNLTEKFEATKKVTEDS